MDNRSSKMSIDGSEAEQHLEEVKSIKPPKEEHEDGAEKLKKATETVFEILKKYPEIVDENRQLQMTLKEYEKKTLLLQREKDQLETEKTEALLGKDKWIDVCTETLKRYKMLKEECLLVVKEHEEMKRKSSELVQGEIPTATFKINRKIDKNKMCDKYSNITSNFKVLQENMKVLEREVLLEYHLMKMGLDSSNGELHTVLEEKKFLQDDNENLQRRVVQLETQMTEMKLVQVATFPDVFGMNTKFNEFQSSVKTDVESSEFSEEIETIVDKGVLFDDRVSMSKRRWKVMLKILENMASDKRVRDMEVARLRKRLFLLEEICQDLQRERIVFQRQLIEQRIDDDCQINTSAKEAEIQISVENSFHQIHTFLSEVSTTIEQVWKMITKDAKSVDSPDETVENEKCVGDENGTSKEAVHVETLGDTVQTKTNEESGNSCNTKEEILLTRDEDEDSLNNELKSENVMTDKILEQSHEVIELTEEQSGNVNVSNKALNSVNQFSQSEVPLASLFLDKLHSLENSYPNSKLKAVGCFQSEESTVKTKKQEVEKLIDRIADMAFDYEAADIDSIIIMRRLADLTSIEGMNSSVFENLCQTTIATLDEYRNYDDNLKRFADQFVECGVKWDAGIDHYVVEHLRQEAKQDLCLQARAREYASDLARQQWSSNSNI